MIPKTSMATPSAARVTPKLRGAALCVSVPASRSFWKNWKMVKPKPMSESDVRITDISVRSALIRVRWNDMPVRRIDISVRSVDIDVRALERSVRYSDSDVRCSDSPVRWLERPVRYAEYWTDAISVLLSSTFGMGGTGDSGSRAGRVDFRVATSVAMWVSSPRERMTAFHFGRGAGA